MKIDYDCIACFIRQTLDALREVTSDNKKTEHCLRRVLRVAAEFDFELSPPEMSRHIHKIIREETGSYDPYKKIKEGSIEIAKSMEPDVRRRINAASDPFEAAIRFGIAGNIMDFALTSLWDQKRVETIFEGALRQHLDLQVIEELRASLVSADLVLILGDNAGETVFDRVMIDFFPGKASIIYAVKGSPVINDAVMEDARASDLDTVARLIDNGNDAPGTVLSLCSDQFLKIFKKADVVISKGQANFETLNGIFREVYFLTQIKCPVIARFYDYQVGDWVVTTTSRCLQGGQ